MMDAFTNNFSKVAYQFHEMLAEPARSSILKPLFCQFAQRRVCFGVI